MNPFYLNAFPLSTLLLFFLLASCQPAPIINQPEVKATTVNLIQDQGLNFKDLNKNGTLDPYALFQYNEGLSYETPIS